MVGGKNRGEQSTWQQPRGRERNHPFQVPADGNDALLPQLMPSRNNLLHAGTSKAGLAAHHSWWCVLTQVGCVLTEGLEAAQRCGPEVDTLV